MTASGGLKARGALLEGGVIVKDDTATGKMPVARWEDLVVTEAGADTLVYDTSRHHIHHLNSTTATVWRHCRGQHTIAEVAFLTGIDEATVRIALTQLDDANLLLQPLASRLRMSRLSRRAMLRRAGVAATVALPAIASVTAPARAGLSDDGSCNDPCKNSDKCPLICRNCVEGYCAFDICGLPCDDAPDRCDYLRSGYCSACVGEPGNKTCQKPETAGSGMGVMGMG